MSVKPSSLSALSLVNTMKITVERIKELIHDQMDALDKHVLMYEQTQIANFHYRIAEIKFGVKTLNELLQTIEAIEHLPGPTH